jgi:hypothetical protein
MTRKPADHPPLAVTLFLTHPGVKGVSSSAMYAELRLLLKRLLRQGEWRCKRLRFGDEDGTQTEDEP